MSSIKTKLGPVTAYADAVEGGYKGSRADFRAYMANWAENAQAVYAAKSAAEEAQTAAETAETNAKESERVATDSMNVAVERAARAYVAINNAKFVSVDIDTDGHLYFSRTEAAEDVNITMEEGRLVLTIE